MHASAVLLNKGIHERRHILVYVYCSNPNKKALECTEIQFELLLLVYSVGVLYELYLQHFNKNDKNEFVWEKKNHIWAGD